MKPVTVGALVALAFLVGLSLQAGGKEWVNAPLEGYGEPNCPPHHAPEFFGVVVINGASSPVYQCNAGAEPGNGVSWSQIQNSQG